MNKDTLKKLPLLLDTLNEDLSVITHDFVKNDLLSQYKINPNKLHMIIKETQKYAFDTKTNTIKFREKADRNILILMNILKENNDQVNELNEKEQWIKSAISDYGKNYINGIKKIERVKNNIHILFINEDYSTKLEEYMISKIKVILLIK
jgi:hypothetical protein